MKLILAGYTAAPSDPKNTLAYYGQLVKAEQADGLEFAWSGPQMPELLQPVLALLPSSWCITINDIPATARACAANPLFGLASPDDAGREQALGMLREISTAIKTLNDRAGRQVVFALEIHCAPGFDKRVRMPDAAALARSLDVAGKLPWDGCRRVLEHCDAFVPGQKPAKGFLTLGEEIKVLRELAGAPITLGLNWGRSMIELRDPDRVIDHARQAAPSGLLDAYTFCGTVPIDNVYGEAWFDSHVPFADTLDSAYSEPASGLTIARAAQVLEFVRDCSFLAIKTNWPAKRSDPLERAASVMANFDTLVELLKTDSRIASQLRLKA
jgi:hypothetical protein